MLGDHAQSDKIERLLCGEVLEQALMALVDDVIGVNVVARIDADKQGAALGELSGRLQVAGKRAAARADVEPPCGRGHDAEDERFVKVGWK